MLIVGRSIMLGVLRRVLTVTRVLEFFRGRELEVFFGRISRRRNCKMQCNNIEESTTEIQFITLT